MRPRRALALASLLLVTPLLAGCATPGATDVAKEIASARETIDRLARERDAAAGLLAEARAALERANASLASGRVEDRTRDLDLLLSGSVNGSVAFFRWRLAPTDERPDERLLASGLGRIVVRVVDEATFNFDATPEERQRGLLAAVVVDPADLGEIALPTSALVHLETAGDAKEIVWSPSLESYAMRNETTGAWEASRVPHGALLRLPFPATRALTLVPGADEGA